MRKEIILRKNKICYNLEKSRRTKNIRLSVRAGGEVRVVIPFFLKESLAEEFIIRKSNWLLKKINYFQKKNNSAVPSASRKDYLKYKKSALEKIESKVKQFNSFYGFSFQKISIRNQKTRWGSCSRRGNLSFNYRIIFLPELLSDYIIVHELCHLGQLNHSGKFWELVGKTIPDFKKIRKEIKFA